MIKNFILGFTFIFFSNILIAQYPPAADMQGSTAIHADSSCFISWATNCIVERGYINIADTSAETNDSNKATYGNSEDGIGKANNNVVSLGDKGTAILTFENPIINGNGWDFAVFENALNDEFLELAYVEISSNGTDYFRFPAVSLTQTETQTNGFGSTDPELIDNLAGKYKAMYGTPFNIDDIEDNALLDKNNITHVKIIDVGGSIDSLFASYDNLGNVINDPFPTPFSSAGFDLDAIGVINNSETNIVRYSNNKFNFYPNPSNDIIYFPDLENLNYNFYIYNLNSVLIYKSIMSDNAINISHLASGVYLLKMTYENKICFYLRIVKI